MVQDCINGMGSDGGNSALLNINNSDILSFLQQQTQSSDGFSLNLDGQRAAMGSSQFPSSFLNNRGAPTNMLLNSGLNLQQLASDLEGKRSSSSQNMTECVPVPSSEHVAEIVGRQGCKIKALRAKTNTYIKTPVRGDEPIFVVTGRREDVANAKREILSAADHFSQIRACRRSNLNGSMAPGPPANLPGHVTEYVEVPYKVVGLVVGPKGATIKKIQQSTNTYIVTPSRDREPKFEISGLPENVSKAKKLIQEHIAERTGFSSDNMPVSFEALNRFASASNLAGGNLGQNLMGDQTQSLNTMLSNNNPTLGAIARSQFNAPNSYLNSLNSIPSNFSASDFAMAGFTGFGTMEGGNLTPSVPLNNLGGLSTSSLNSNSTSIANNILAQPFGTSLAESVSSFGLGGRSTRPSSEEWEAFRNPSFGGNYASLGRIGSRSSDEGIGSSSNSSPALNDAVQNPWNSVLTNPLSSGSNRQSPDLRSDAFDPIREVTQSMGNFGFQQAQSEAFTSSKDMLLQSTNALLASAASTSTPSEESLFSFSAGASDTNSLSPLSRQSPTNSKVKRCHYCTSTKVNAFFVPCGHNVTCGECAFKLENESRQCPLCHQTVTQVVGHLGDESGR